MFAEAAVPIAVQVCHGSGVQVMMRPLGPGMMQQIQQPCSNCNQTGYSVPSRDVCNSCHSKVRSPLISCPDVSLSGVCLPVMCTVHRCAQCCSS